MHLGQVHNDDITSKIPCARKANIQRIQKIIVARPPCKRQI